MLPLAAVCNSLRFSSCTAHTILYHAAARKTLAIPRLLEAGLAPPSNTERMKDLGHHAAWRSGSFIVSRAVLAVVAATLGAALAGCNSLYTEGATAGAGVAGAAVASTVTHNAATAAGIGLGAVAAARAGVQFSQRIVHRDTQDSIAKVAGPLGVGAVANWSATHSVPIEEDEHGRVTVSRVISQGALDCKEIVFSVDRPAKKDTPASSAFYVAAVCQDGNAWKWASAEPATERWGALQ